MPSCPLCSASVAASSLEAHLRLELSYPAYRCLLCPAALLSAADVPRHFAGPLAAHPGQPETLVLLPEQPDKEARLLELMRLAKGGSDAVESRLCVCGGCRLVCREDLTLISAQRYGAVENQDYRVQEPLEQASAADYRDTFTGQNLTRADEDQRSRKRPRQSSQGASDPNRVPEASEPENQGGPSGQPLQDPDEASLFRVKAELEDVKPELAADGKVACLLCGLRVGKDSFKKHALGAHMSARPFQCGLCPLKAKLKSELAKHQRKEHERALSSESFLFTGSGSEVERTLEECFGSVKDIDWARVRCKPCDKLLNKMNAKRHIVQHHISKPFHRCRLCSYESRDFSAGQTNAHVKKAHGERPGPETVDSAEAQHYAPIVKSMMDELFVPQ